MTVLLVQILTGIAGASSLFLVAAGLTVIFGVTRVVNFSHGSLYMLGAYIAWSVFEHLPHTPLGFVLSAAAAALALGILGAALEVTLLRRIYRAPELLQLLATFGVVLMVQDIAQAIWGAEDLTIARPHWMRTFVVLGGERFPLYDLILIAAGPVVLGLLWLILHRTRFGTLVRAATQDRDMVAALGVDQRALFTAVFALGAALAGLGGALGLPDGSANLQLDLSVITDAFVVVVVGGLGSITGAYLASLLIGILQALGVLFVPKLTLVMVFVVMAAVLVLRPEGLLGRAGATVREATAPPLVRPAEPALLGLGLAGLIALALAPLIVGPFALSVLTEAMTAVLFAASLHFMMGPGGMPSFGHAAWFGLGAYAVALAKTLLAAPMPLALLMAPALAAVVALAFGWFVVRLAGVYLAMLTLAFAQIVWAVAVQWAEITGGDNGILGVWPPHALASSRAFYWFSLVVCTAGALALRRMLYAPFGYALRGARDSDLRAEAIGLPTARLRLVAFVIAGAAAGLAGGMTAFGKGSVFPTYLSIGHSVDALLMVLLGGVQTMAGPIVGALAYTGLYDVLLLVTGQWR
ncbi:MAG: ABC transporter permease, partial [Acetobacteraceae bacterium]|nr:ABC transporter permease [Acetobacteraceae bacterium]